MPDTQREDSPGDATIISIDGVVAAVCDQASKFNRPTIAADGWASTTIRGPNSLFEYNAFMHDQMVAGHAFVWILLIWGSYRLRVRAHPSDKDLPPLDASLPLIADLREAVIDFPTGRLGWMDVEAAASAPWRPLAIVAPGRYLCRMTGEENSAHWCINPRDYPPHDEDWTLHIAPAPA